MAHNHSCPDRCRGFGRFRMVMWNVRGLNDARKVRKVVAYLHKHKVYRAILQEMHLAPGSPMLTPRRLQGQFLVAGFTSHTWGVLVWALRSPALASGRAQRIREEDILWCSVEGVLLRFY
ncbi:hypothetical protein NDU88_002577 [Pleurodeles waltl]|uniref:Uncharacterized protein n=1 Tax=Pleurodeles waltl TaxID=8319 RepID=A0AAV7VZR2_PLEWA|nr:hypothetical protein NDU88_002577 [Pleurodeles waltl]